MSSASEMVILLSFGNEEITQNPLSSLFLKLFTCLRTNVTFKVDTPHPPLERKKLYFVGHKYFLDHEKFSLDPKSQKSQIKILEEIKGVLIVEKLFDHPPFS